VTWRLLLHSTSHSFAIGPMLHVTERRALRQQMQTSSRIDLDRLFPEVYAELRRLAHRRLRAEPDGHTLSTTALVHETYLKLSADRGSEFGNREHFFALAARAMRRILVDYARRHRATKRSADRKPVSLSALEVTGSVLDQPVAIQASQRADVLVAVDEALTRLGEVDERLARVVEYRFFTGLTERETAELLGVTARTVARDWVRARGWLLTHLDDDARAVDA
jgi:RNA polymerase sigma factor (TIGR02999 family)